MSYCPLELPPEGLEIFRDVAAAALARGESEAAAERRAWKIVRKSYRRHRGGWIRRKPPKQSYAARGRVIRI